MIDIGKRLQESREKNGLSYEDLFEKTRIPVETIKKIEKNQIHDLPQPYYLAFVRTLAGEVGCDADELIQEIQLDAADKDEMDEGSEMKNRHLSILPAIQAFWKKQKVWLPVVLIVIFVIVLIELYVKYGKNLFSEPEIPGLEKKRSVLSDTTGIGFLFYVIGLDKSTMHVIQDSSLRQTIQLQANEKMSWTCEDSIYLELESPMAVALYLNHNQLPFHLEDSTAILQMLITESGIHRLNEKERPKSKIKNISEVKTEEPKQVLLGHIEPSELIDKCPGVLHAGKAYQADPAIVEKILSYNPSMSLLFFIGTWDETSLILAGQVLRLMDQMQLSGLTLSIIGVDQTLHDRAGLVDFHRVQGVPTLLFLSHGNELGRVVGKSTEPVEKRFLNNIEILEMIRVAQPADPSLEDEEF